ASPPPSLHDALPIYVGGLALGVAGRDPPRDLGDLPRCFAAQRKVDAMAQINVALAGRQAQEVALAQDGGKQGGDAALSQLETLRSEEHTSELQSRGH